ncbi:MAG: Type I Iterative PKS [Alyxoria varia]|nr:MAG: Type I Iterative PKS [Alyxoria varia]
MAINSDVSDLRRPRLEDFRTNSASKKYVQEPVAVVGMACRLPGQSNSPQQLWEFLERGGVAKNGAPESRFKLKGHHDGSVKPKTMRSPGGMFLEDVDVRKFDAAFFGIPKTDAIAMDPQQRQLLEVVYECLENSGITLDSLDGARIGCFVGSYAVDYADMQARDPDDRAPSVTIGVGRAILSNRISHFLNIQGPSMTIDTACSGSLVSVDVACRYLSTGEVEGALVAGANLYLSPEHNMDSGAMKGASSPSGKCHTFDVKADGYIKAEGINAVYLKRLSTAIRDGDPIRAVIRGTATNSDGKTPGIASPSSEAQALAIRAAYANAGISDFYNTKYVECHGTGTQAGDPTEVKGVASVFATSRALNDPLIIGSVKSNIGHSEPAAGISGLLKAILALENGTIPGNPTFITPNPNIDFQTLKVRASRTAIKWPSGSTRRASVNSFGYGGSNVHVVVEKPAQAMSHHTASFIGAPEDEDIFAGDEPASPASLRPYTLVFSANDESSVRAYTQAMRKHLMNPNVRVNLPDLAYTLSERRTHHFNRAYIVTRGSKLDENSFVLGKKQSEAPEIGFVFTGQGAQWSQMGKGLVESIPLAKSVLRHLDDVLKTISYPPSWSLLSELTESRSPELLRQPEFSQPLVTALQLALLAVLRSWGIEAQAVVGHSSGEIAAACAAGYLTPEEAIKAAYYRGYAAKVQSEESTSSTAMGMMAVGLGSERVQEYLKGHEHSVSIACFNSPSSLTLSGSMVELEKIRTALTADSHFARMLQVNLAYHSKAMNKIGEDYVEYLERDFTSLQMKESGAMMFSSVLGKEMDQLADKKYWQDNMISPVRFHEAVASMISQKDGPKFLVELGPSGALAGPVGQIVKEALGSVPITYCTSLSRGPESVKSLFDVPGRIFLAGGSVNMRLVNSKDSSQDTLSLQTSTSPEAAVITDLPNYRWNHSNEYWYESESSKDWRNRMFGHHDLMGTKILGTSWVSPAWRKTLKVEDLTWLKDHKMGSDIVFPGAGYIAMAIESARQREQALNLSEGKESIPTPRFRLRNVTFPKALVLEEGKEAKIQIFLAVKSTWLEFKVVSVNGETWTEHGRGLVRVEEDQEATASNAEIRPLEHPTPGVLWYKAMSDVGYGFGPRFQKQDEVESIPASRDSRAIVDLAVPDSEYHQSAYKMHPACIDGCMQTCAPSLWDGERTNVSAVLVPAIIDDLIIRSSVRSSAKGIAVSSSRYSGLGLPSEAKNYYSDTSVYDQESGALLLQLSGLRYHQIDTATNIYGSHKYSRTFWKPDVSHLTQEALQAFTNKPMIESCLTSPVAEKRGQRRSTIHDVIDIIAHKKPTAKVLEVDGIPGSSTSLWLQKDVRPNDEPSTVRAAYSRFHYTSNDASALTDAEEKYEDVPNSAYSMLEINASSDHFSAPDNEFDFAIVKLQSGSGICLSTAIQNVQSMLNEGAYLLLLNYSSGDSPEKEDEFVEVCSSAPGSPTEAANTTLQSNGFASIRNISCIDEAGVESAQLSVYVNTNGSAPMSSAPLHLLSLQEQTSSTSDKFASLLKDSGFDVVKHTNPELNDLPSSGVSLVLDELTNPILPTLSPKQWNSLKKILTAGSRLLWVTTGSQMDVTNPSGAMIHGLCRTVRSEDISISITTLDVEQPENTTITVNAITNVLNTLYEPTPMKQVENEYVERNGITYVCRIHPDEPVNHYEAENTSGAEIADRKIHDEKTTIRMQAERVGNVDSLQYTEVAPQELPLPDNTVETEIAAAGLNFKDVAITMGIVPENQQLLGLEGAGYVRRVGKNLRAPFCVGQRVLVFEKGTFANRIIATTERTYPIPDSMSFEEASTLASVYLTALYSIFDLASTKKGDKVLIHSATGGLGIACIQICQYIGAEVYATVGTEEKRTFLTSTFSIPPSNIFNSRSAAFAPQLMAATRNRGVNVIINSLTGDLLDASWRCIADSGVMIELGKKDHLDRNSLSMEPFARNASFRCFDMSHKCVSDALIARLLRQLFGMMEAGHVKPISPIKIFAFEDIPSAFRFMRGANHIGKIVISNDGKQSDIKVPVRRALTPFTLRAEVSYLVVGGLKGLCGSLALDMARHGARHLIVLQRSAYDDTRSQAVLHAIRSQGCQVICARGDVSVEADVRAAFESAPTNAPVAGVIQGAMVLRDRPLESMTIDEYHTTVQNKVAGTWNLHNVSQSLELDLDFFTLLSSISGLVGQKGQANYAAANVFLDSFAAYRRKLGLRATSVDLGAIEDVGYMHQHSDLMEMLDTSAWTPINEGLFHKIVRFSTMQQGVGVAVPGRALNPASSSQLITSIAVPQGSTSLLTSDARFSSLLFSSGSSSSSASGSENSSAVAKDIKALKLLLKSNPERQAVLDAVIPILNHAFQKTLRLGEAMEPAKPLSAYGLDSLSAVELRNWVRLEVGAELTTLEVTGAGTLTALGERVVGKLMA